MSKHLHIMANPGDIAETVLLPGDPLRAKFIAENFLEDAVCYNKVRGMLGYTGTYKGKRVSVQGTGMGMPSISIYINELITEYGCKNLIRIGSCGSIKDDVNLRDIILAMSASTTSGINKRRFPNMDYAPTADFDLLNRAYQIATEKNYPIKVGSVLTSDLFYDDGGTDLKRLAEYGLLAVEMETAELYTTAAKHGVKALAIITVSDHIFKGLETSPEERQETFTDMMDIALNLA
jgi:purine-nucleoside phosphorylase